MSEEKKIERPEAEVKEKQLKEGEVRLPSGAIAEVKPFKGKHVRIAQMQGGTDQSKFLFSLIAQCVFIDGKPVIMELLDEMHGPDVLHLMGLFGENF